MWRSVGYLAKREGVVRQTIQKWIKNGKYETVKRTEGGHFRVWIEEEPLIFYYARVSTNKQKSSLETQISLLKAKGGEKNAKEIKDIGSGFNFNRQGFKTILERSLSGIPCIIVATTSDRITRTGFGLIKRIIELSGGQIRLLEEDIEESESFDTESLVSFITSYIASYNGKRSSERRKGSNNYKED
jgi:predicted site-specific integrase-resolvase